MVDKLKQVLSQIKANKGAVTLFAIIKMDEVTDKWSVFLSAPWINEQNMSEIFSYVRNLLLQSLSEEEKTTIARIGIFTSNEHIVQLITNSIKVEAGSIATIKDTQLNGYKIQEAYIFESNPVLP